MRIWTKYDFHSPTFGRTQGFERLWLDPLVRFQGLETFCLAVEEPFFDIFEKERERMGWNFRILNSKDGRLRGLGAVDDDGDSDESDDS